MLSSFWSQEFLKATVDLADLVGIHVVMTRVAGKGETKFLVAGLGWASAELLMTRFVPLWVGARGMEFDWRYVQLSFDSNISLVSAVSISSLRKTPCFVSLYEPPWPVQLYQLACDNPFCASLCPLSEVA